MISTEHGSVWQFEVDKIYPEDTLVARGGFVTLIGVEFHYALGDDGEDDGAAFSAEECYWDARQLMPPPALSV